MGGQKVDRNLSRDFMSLHDVGDKEVTSVVASKVLVNRRVGKEQRMVRKWLVSLM